MSSKMKNFVFATFPYNIETFFLLFREKQNNKNVSCIVFFRTTFIQGPPL